jgi:hypothetical protein
MNENIKHLREIINHNNLTNDTTRAEAQVVLDLLEADLREAREREKPEVRGLLHTIVKWINAGHMVPNDHEIMTLHTDKKRATAAKMGVRLAMGAWLSAANKAVEPHEDTATPMLDPALSNLAAALSWAKGNDERKIIVSHGGKHWYIRLEDEDGESPSDAVNDDLASAIGDAICGMEAKR